MDNAYLTRLQIIAEDLTTLEINTMVIPGLTARKMPDLLKALDEIADCYEQTLIEIDPGFSNDGIGKIVDRFSAIEVQARKAIRALEVIKDASARDKSRFVIAQRIKSNSGEIIGILNEYAGANNIDVSSITFVTDLPKPLASQNVLRIRRIWDVATEEVVMQTLVQLNGDVVTRVTEFYASDEYRVLHKVHADSVMVSMDMWKELIATLAAFFSQLLDRFKIGAGS